MLLILEILKSFFGLKLLGEPPSVRFDLRLNHLETLLVLSRVFHLYVSVKLLPFSDGGRLFLGPAHELVKERQLEHFG